MKIKTKLTFGVGLLFLLILFLALVSSWFINSLKKDTNNILTANYLTLQYSRNMILALEEISADPNAIQIFEANLQKQKLNVTEIGESEGTKKIEQHFENLKNNLQSTELPSLLRKDITEVMRVNMQSIERKSDLANETAETAYLWISLTSILCFVIAFLLLVKLPGNIANPIKELSNSIKQIAAQNYHQRVHFDHSNEFGELASSFNTMAQKLEEYSESKLDKIIQGKKRIETLINNMHDPVIGIDENKNILFINHEALTITGLKEADVLGKQIQDIALHNDLVRSLTRDLLLPEKQRTDKVMKIFADNKESYFEKEFVDIQIIPTGEQKTQLIGYVILLKNITALKELDIAKTNFIGTVSHEFKTPISSIKMSLQLLENDKIGSLNQEQKNLLESIKDDSNRLLKITGELVNITQVESGNVQLSILPCDPADIMHYAIEATKTQAEQKNIKFAISNDKILPKILADCEKTAWIITNLISNAIRYSYENSSIYLAITTLNNKVIFSVKDTGLGIPTQFQHKIFDRYYRVPGTQKDGTGLGLAISKEFVEAQGGEIIVTSAVGLGSTFEVILNVV